MLEKLLKHSTYIILILFSLTTFGQKPSLYFEKITNKSGRSFGFTSKVVQGDDDYLWIATSKGLLKYNGYSFKQFRHSSNNKQSIASSTVSSIIPAPSGKLWLKHFDQFSLFSPSIQDSIFEKILSQTFNVNSNLSFDIEGNIWIGPYRKGMLRVDTLGNSQWFKHQPSVYSPLATQLIQKHYASSEWKIDKEALKKDTVVSFNVESNQTVIIIGTGEIFKGQIFDYAYLTHKKDTVWKVNIENARFLPGSKSSAIQVDTLTLKPGKYSLHYSADDSDMENASAFTEGGLPASGAYIKVLNKDEIAKTSKAIYKAYTLPFSLSSENILHSSTVENGTLFLFSTNTIETYNPKNKSFVSQKIKLPAPFNKSSHATSATYGEDIWIGTDKGLLHYSSNSKKIDTIYSSLDPKKFIGPIYSLCQVNNELWIGTNNGITVYNTTKKTFHHYKANDETNLWGNKIFSIDTDKSGNVWVSTSKGLNRLQKHNFYHVDLPLKKYSKFPVASDKNSLLTFHAYKNFITQYSATQESQEYYSLPDSIFPYNTLFEETDYKINCIKKAQRHTYYISIGNSVYKTYGETFQIQSKHTLRGIKYGKDSVRNKCYETHIDGEGKAWIVSTNSIELFGRGSYTTFGPNYSKARSIDFKYVVSSYLDSRDKIWIRTKDSIFSFCTSKKDIEHRWALINPSHQRSPLKGNITETSDGMICFASLPYIYRFNSKSKTLSTDSISCNMDIGGSYIISGKEKWLWIYTDNGLFKVDKTDFSFDYLTVENGLADNNISGVIEDDYGKLWVTTLKGLSIVQVDDNSCESYFLPTDNKHYNFSGSNIRLGKYKDTLLMFTNRGILHVNTTKINKRKPKISIESLLIKGKSIPIDSIKKLNWTLDLPHNQNFLAIEFATLDYSAPTKNKYQYYLEGLETEWQYKDASSRTATYTNLSPGEYTFHIKGCNNDYIWNEEGLKLHITINAPWWRTWTAYFSYILLITGGLFGFIKARERQLKAEKEILEQKVTERTFEIRQKQKEITKQRDEIAEQQKSIMDSIHYASRIQQAVLPPADMTNKILPEHFILSKPRDIVSGDYYWAHGTEEQTIIAAADCTGHGVPGAFMSMLGVSFLNQIAAKTKTFTASVILDELKDQVIKSLHQTGKIGEAKDGMDIALCILDNNKKELQFAGAYNPLYIVRNGEISQIKADRMPIGFHHKNDQTFTTSTYQLEKGDCLYIFSDGYADQFGGELGKKFMAKRFKQLLLDVNSKPMNQQQEILNETIENWRGKQEQVDDILVIGIRI